MAGRTNPAVWSVWGLAESGWQCDTQIQWQPEQTHCALQRETTVFTLEEQATAGHDRPGEYRGSQCERPNCVCLSDYTTAVTMGEKHFLSHRYRGLEITVNGHILTHHSDKNTFQ
jgi:hypothetical protein